MVLPLGQENMLHRYVSALNPIEGIAMASLIDIDYSVYSVI